MTKYIAPDLFATIVEWVPWSSLKTLSKASPIFDKIIADSSRNVVFIEDHLIILDKN